MSSFTDFLRPISPPPHYRRGSLNLKSFSLDQDISLSSSLPLSISKDDNSLDIHKKLKQETQKGKH